MPDGTIVFHRHRRFFFSAKHPLYAEASLHLERMIIAGAAHREIDDSLSDTEAQAWRPEGWTKYDEEKFKVLSHYPPQAYWPEPDAPKIPDHLLGK